jgi:hypothetical protein
MSSLLAPDLGLSVCQANQPYSTPMPYLVEAKKERKNMSGFILKDNI